MRVLAVGVSICVGGVNVNSIVVRSVYCYAVFLVGFTGRAGSCVCPGLCRENWWLRRGWWTG